MIRFAAVGLLALAFAQPLGAAEFPLTFHTIVGTNVMSFPGGYGNYAPLRADKPSTLGRQPAAVSQRPLFGEWSIAGGSAVVFRLDESKGTGKGYDRLLADMNGNRDLTDDQAVLPIELPDRVQSPQGPRYVMFGPIEAPTKAAVAGGRPEYYAGCYIYSEGIQSFVGQANFRAGWYLDAEVDLDGAKTRIGVYDGDANFVLGDLARSQTYRTTTGESWSFSGGDNFLLDLDRSGTFTRALYPTEASAFGELLYFGAKPYRVAVAADRSSITVEPWQQALAEVWIQPKGEQTRSVSLAWQLGNDRWQLLTMDADQGRVRVPPGKYRLYSCTLIGDRPAGDRVLAVANQRKPKTPVQFEAGKSNTLVCGGGLDLKVTASVRTAQSWENLKAKSAQDSDMVLVINGSVTGADEEVYSSYGAGAKFDKLPPKPAFTVVSGGAEVGNGNLEFG